MERCMKVEIGIVVTEEEVKNHVKSYGGNPDELDDEAWRDYVETKYSMGWGASASFC